MTRRRLFGSHLYSQIIVPLLAASLLVGVFATTVTVLFLRDLTGRWVTEVADSATSNLQSNLENYAIGMQRVVWLAASDPNLQRIARTRDIPALQAAVHGANTGLEYDDLMVLDESGTVLAASGPGGIRQGEVPLGEQGVTRPGAGRALRTLITRVGGKVALVSIQPFAGTDGRYYSVAITRVISDDFLRSLAGKTGSAFCFYDRNGQMVACTLSGKQQSSAERALAASMSGNTPAREAMSKATSSTGGISHLDAAGTSYEVFARELVHPSTSFGGDGELLGYAVGTVSQTVSEQAAGTIIDLVIIWSIVAVVALSGIGSWLARSVSGPLDELAAGARRIADGDLSTKVRVSGSAEVEQLGEAFNEMTDSLRDRSETLNKKVLELATLYEMSRALGSTLDMDELLGSVLDSALRIFDLDLGYVTLRDRESSVLAIRAVRGGAGEPTDAVRSSMSEWVVREGRPLIFNPDPTGGQVQIDLVTGARAALCVPLSSSEGTIGSITVGSADTEYRFNSEDVRLLATIANHVAIAIGNIELFSSLQDAYLATVRSLAAAVDAKDSFTRGHSDRVATYATAIAQRMGVAHEQRIALEMAAYLHDIGKIGVPEEILLKPGKLTDEEMAQMRHHPLIGANILKQVTFPWAITPVVRHHHEQFDGSGYPAGLKGEEIPLLARILTAADAFEAMTADRPYRRGFSAEEAVDELNRCAGTQFDPRVIATLVELLDEERGEAAGASSGPVEEISPEERRVIFAALVDGVLGSFRHLGGPRLASNVETEVDERFEAEGWPFRITRGRVRFVESAAPSGDDELDLMREAMRSLDVTLSRVSGSTLVDHYYTDAYGGFSERMRQLASELGLRA